MNEQKQVNEAWKILNGLQASLNCGCIIDADIDDLVNLAWMCKQYIKAIEKAGKY